MQTIIHCRRTSSPIRDIRVALVPMLLIVTALGATLAVAQTSAVSSAAAQIEDGLFVVCLRRQFPEIQRSGDGHTAFDPKSGRNFAYEGNAWIDVKTLETICPKSAAQVEDGLFVVCLRRQFPEIQRSGDGHTAFDPKSGRNFAYDGKAWIDTKTLESICPKIPASQRAERPTTTPQIGMVIEPRISGGLFGSSGSTSYASTGSQPPFSGDTSNTTGQICGGATFYPGFAVGPARVGLDVNICSGSGDTLFSIPRHGPGNVDLRASTGVIIDVLFKGEVPVGPSNNIFLSAGIGPTFRQLDLTLASNQSFFGGGVPSASSSTWQTGLAVGAGAATYLCPDCIAGNPLKIGLDGRVRFFPSQSVSLRSPSFGFTETGRLGRTTDYSVLVTFGVPLNLSDIRAKRDIVEVARLHDGIGLYRYRYKGNDQAYVGVMAQEVAKIVPDAVVLAPDGYLRVDCGRLGLRLLTWEEWTQ